MVPRQGRSSVWNPTVRGEVAEPRNFVNSDLIFGRLRFWFPNLDFGLVMCLFEIWQWVLRI